MSRYILNDNLNIYKFVDTEIARILNKQIHQTPNKKNTRVVFKSKCNKYNKNFKHVYLEFIDNDCHYTCEKSPTWKNDSAKLLFTQDDITIELPNIILSIDDIKYFESQQNNNYILGINDCRHHVCNLLDFCYPS